ncbi:protein PHOSPHATE-INDUCED 1 homolog [Phragmites australis]|uniref:protein PHOSPHATE-INDUCED 1 homolog n=1 Tax=Phragmites australis TaxID=29695 RepID=UPI002D772573|nr:protein PHOSPHATE-INDUCED 1 homolog [Phragmites australis]
MACGSATMKKLRQCAGCGLLLALLVSFARPCHSLYHPTPPVVAYHHGAVLDGAVPVSVLYYGTFSPHQKAIVADFLLSLSPRGSRQNRFGVPGPAPPPSVAQWWETVDRYVRKAGREPPRVLLASQVSDEACSLGKYLSRAQVEHLAARLGVAPGGVAVVLTAADVAVEGFCSSACGAHGASAPGAAGHVWVGNAAVQCPGRCAWPFHTAEGFAYGPGQRRGRDETLRAPNGDFSVDGMVINLAELLAGAVTNPYGHGYFQGDPSAPVEVAAACPGVYGRGAYPGYPGAVRLDTATGAGYNVVGRNGRKYLVPALVDPDNYSCIIMA